MGKNFSSDGLKFCFHFDLIRVLPLESAEWNFFNEHFLYLVYIILILRPLERKFPFFLEHEGHDVDLCISTIFSSLPRLSIQFMRSTCIYVCVCFFRSFCCTLFIKLSAVGGCI